MESIYVHGITKISKFPKIEDWDVNFKIVSNFKKKVGRRYLFFPVYEDLGESVVTWWTENFVSTTKEFKHSKLFIEDGKFYHKPHISIYMNNKSRKDIYFNSIEEMDAKYRELRNLAPNVNFD
jgi:hypothetical protein